MKLLDYVPNNAPAPANGPGKNMLPIVLGVLAAGVIIYGVTVVWRINKQETNTIEDH